MCVHIVERQYSGYKDKQNIYGSGCKVTRYLCFTFTTFFSVPLNLRIKPSLNTQIFLITTVIICRQGGIEWIWLNDFFFQTPSDFLCTLVVIFDIHTPQRIKWTPKHYF